MQVWLTLLPSKYRCGYCCPKPNDLTFNSVVNTILQVRFQLIIPKHLVLFSVPLFLTTSFSLSVSLKVSKTLKRCCYFRMFPHQPLQGISWTSSLSISPSSAKPPEKQSEKVLTFLKSTPGNLDNEEQLFVFNNRFSGLAVKMSLNVIRLLVCLQYTDGIYS